MVLLVFELLKTKRNLLQNPNRFVLFDFLIFNYCIIVISKLCYFKLNINFNFACATVYLN